MELQELDELLAVLRRRGFRVVGPTVRDGAIVYDDVASSADLPAGWADEQDGGTYRLRRREDDALFGYNAGPQSWKQYLFPPSTPLWRGRRNGQEIAISASAEATDRFAFIGVRSCELHAI